MIRTIIWLFFAGALSTFASSLEGWEIHNALEFDLGYRHDDLNWISKAPSLGVSTEQNWTEMRSLLIACQDELYLGTDCQALYLRGYADYGKLFTGNKKFTQNSLDEPFELETQLEADSGGFVADGSFAAGFQFRVPCTYLFLIPLVGYSYHYQKFEDNNYQDRIGTINFFRDVHSNYKYYWKGLWYGMRLEAKVPYWRIFGEYQYHAGNFRGTVEDNFIDNSAKENLEANRAIGSEVMGGVYYAYDMPWMIGFNVNYRYWKAKHGTSTISGEDPASLDAAKWHTFSISGCVQYCF